MAFSYVSEATNLSAENNENWHFTFLNVSQPFVPEKIDWNYNKHGKLWTYNLNYFDFLFLKDLSYEQKAKCISDYCEQSETLLDGLEPYPISLRGINWIKFFSSTNLLDEQVNKVLYSHYKVLMANIEYHIMANHLIENGFSLLFGAYHFRNEAFYKKASSILIQELDEQILADGAHFERSPMYHQIMLHRVLDCINLVSNNNWKQSELLEILVSKAEKMLYWINEVSFSNGDIPMVQDSAFGVAPSTEWLNNYADKLNIQTSDQIECLSDSGYRKLTSGKMELFLDVGAIAPSYQPGHAHAGEANFVLYANSKPIIVDVGVSTYEKNERRQLERSTLSHNCINISNKNSSEVWGGFRVARRASVELKRDKATEIQLEHNGYGGLGITISRNLKLIGNAMSIIDSIQGVLGDMDAELRLHIHPDISPSVTEDKILLGSVSINIAGGHEVAVESYMFATGFNKSVEASLIRLRFKSESKLIVENAD